MKFCLLPLTLLAVFGLAVAAETNYPLDAPAPDGRRPGGTITQEFTPPPLHDEENKDVRRERNYPEQPPTIPHSIRGYHVDKNANKCLSCHSRANSARAQAPMISITHYTDRDQQTLAAVAPGTELRDGLERILRGRTGALIVLDVDRLKPINDAFGHAAGDEVLKEFATRIRAQTRGIDVVPSHRRHAPVFP